MRAHESRLLSETIEPMLREQEPNFLRLYLNPHVAQTCFCLDRYIRTTWTDAPSGVEGWQSFLANSLEEALSGAIKLLRYARGSAAISSTGLVLDPTDRLAGFAGVELAGGEHVEFLPSIRVIGARSLREEGFAGVEPRIGPFVLVAGVNGALDALADAIRRLVRRDRPEIIVCLDRDGLAALRRGKGGLPRELVPDIVVFDESFVDHAVPFAAFSAPRSFFAAWNRPGKSTFHSTTFQPNTISTRHFMKCLAAADPDFVQRYAADLRAIGDDLPHRGDAFRRHYNPSLFRLIRAGGFETADVRASGSFVFVNARPVFDVVGGVACSMRGHNPPTYADEVRSASKSGGSAECELRDELRRLTGLEHVLPAVSGATAVENALKLVLVAQFPRRHVLALKAGFGGKTLLSLIGTANSSYKEHVGPLYADVHYVDPFAPDARQQIDALLDRHEFAAVLVELIQSVGGVRRIPESLAGHLSEGRRRGGYLLVVDEVQTGMYRTGPFTQSQALSFAPDVMLLGKGTSDMMFPFSLTLYSSAVADQVASRHGALTEAIRRRYGYEVGYRTVLNTLRRAETLGLSARVMESAEEFRRRLAEGLASINGVREVRVFGMLVAIELDTDAWPRRWIRKWLSAFYLLAMLGHERFPVLAGFCQYEPNTLKITPPLDATTDEIAKACETIVDVLGRPLPRVLFAGLGRLFRPSPMRKENDERRNDPVPELAAR